MDTKKLSSEIMKAVTEHRLEGNTAVRGYIDALLQQAEPPQDEELRIKTIEADFWKRKLKNLIGEEFMDTSYTELGRLLTKAGL